MYFLKPSFAANENIKVMERRIQFYEGDVPETYHLYEGTDFRRLYLNFNRSGSVRSLVLPDDLSKEAETMLLRYSLVGRHMRKIWFRDEKESEKMLTRSFPKEYISNKEALVEFANKFNQYLNKNCSDVEREVFDRHVPNGYQYRSPGQAIYLLNLLHYMRYKKTKNTKLFIFAMCSIICGDETYRLVHLANLCTWFTRDTCNSCFEKGLYVDFQEQAGLKTLITDIVMCGIYHPVLLCISKTLCFCLLFGVVPEHTYLEFKKGDDLHALMLLKMSKGRSKFVDMMTWTNAESNLIKIKEYVKNNYDKAIRSLSLEPGDWVWIKNQGGDRLADLTMPCLFFGYLAVSLTVSEEILPITPPDDTPKLYFDNMKTTKGNSRTNFVKLKFFDNNFNFKIRKGVLYRNRNHDTIPTSLHL
ncbi:uncharacterized protein LOC143147452 [Ptiloglossa arizonensis]|uniref:uncharacterized protein LOC143147452 n=1 Tax=Ptiloglossa arizonensis TaxID=3350558 RepID=UPI003F9FBA29